MAEEDTTTEADSSGLSRRTLIRILIGLGIGIPILVEGLTFLGLVQNAFGDGDEETGAAVGDELFPDTAQRETLIDATLRDDADGRVLALTVRVENTTGLPYAVRLGAVVLRDGSSVEGGGSTGRIPPGETASATGRWTLPAGGRPDSVYVERTTYTDTGTLSDSKMIPLAPVTVEDD